MKRKLYLITVLVGILFLWPATSVVANIINPNFADGDSDGIIDGWIHNELVITWWPDSALAQFLPDGERIIQDAFLRQVFTLDPGSTILSFDGSITGAQSETGIFTAALLDPATQISLVLPVDGQGHFFSISSENIPQGEESLDFSCSLDVSGLSGQVELVFNLNNDYSGESGDTDSYATLSNLTIVPEPITMLLLGLGGLLCRRAGKK